MVILAAIKYREERNRMDNSTEEKNENVIPVTNDFAFVIKEEVCSETDSPPRSPVNRSVNNAHEIINVNNSIKGETHDKNNEIHAEDEDSDCLKIDEDNTQTTSDENGPVDYSQKSSKHASKSKTNSNKSITDNKPPQFSKYMTGLNVGIHGIQFSGGIVYQPTEQSRFISPLLHTADGKQMRPFKAYDASRDILSGLPTLAGYAVPVGGSIHGSSVVPIRLNNIKTTTPASTNNGTPVVPPSTHLMTLATEADKLRQRENGEEKDKLENGLSEEELTSDGNDSYKDDIVNELYQQGLPETEKKKGKKRKTSMDDQMKDETYWERRRKNNEAAKRSRDARRAKEDQIAIRAALLEQENMRLRIELAALKEEMIKLRSTVYGKNGKPS